MFVRMKDFTKATGQGPARQRREEVRLFLSCCTSWKKLLHKSFPKASTSKHVFIAKRQEKLD